MIINIVDPATGVPVFRGRESASKAQKLIAAGHEIVSEPRPSPFHRWVDGAWAFDQALEDAAAA